MLAAASLHMVRRAMPATQSAVMAYRHRKQFARKNYCAAPLRHCCAPSLMMATELKALHDRLAAEMVAIHCRQSHLMRIAAVLEQKCAAA